VSDFPAGLESVPDGTGSTCYVFKTAGLAGAGQCVKNNAASVKNLTAKSVTIYYNSGYGGASQTVPAGGKANLNTTLKNNNASHRSTPNGRVLPSGLHLSSKGATMLATFEGFRSRAYLDAGGNCTIGYGNLLRMGPCTSADKALVWTESYARAQMVKKADSLAANIKPYISSTPLYQHEWDVLVSWTYNFGPGKFPGTGLDSALSASPTRYSSVPTELKKWVYSGLSSAAVWVPRDAERGCDLRERARER